tara:strand:- start:953 stop:1558 length:606 start_codon:yes stop_codon:yes gene_type:complete
MFRNICLIGLPYSGKSVIGNKLYKHLNKGFVDTDDIIRHKYNRSLPKLIQCVGKQNFLDIEKNVVTYLNHKNTVLATGGSVIYSEESMDHIKKVLHCEIYHLFLSKKEFLSRVDNLDERCVITKYNQSLTDLYNERIELYDKYSDKTISACKDVNLDLFRGETYMPTNGELYKRKMYERDMCLQGTYYVDNNLSSYPVPPL